MLDISRDIHSLTDFKKNTSEFVNQLKQTGEPVVRTINGKAELVVQDAAAYQELRQIPEEARLLEGVRQGIEDMRAGPTTSLDEFEKHVRNKADKKTDWRISQRPNRGPGATGQR
jgi:PHD/YefM family antitoxin component YafN of YafNO toxin-antitoxin module